MGGRQLVATDASTFKVEIVLPIQVDEQVAADYIKNLVTEALCKKGCPPYKVEAWFCR